MLINKHVRLSVDLEKAPSVPSFVLFLLCPWNLFFLCATLWWSVAESGLFSWK